MPPKDQLAIVLVMRVADATHVHPRASQQRCSRCQAAVWVSPASIELLDHAPAVCLRCLTVRDQLAMLRGGAVMTRAQCEEVAEALASRN